MDAVVIAGQTVADFLREHHRDLLGAVTETLVREVPVYAALPRELIDGDVRRVIDRTLDLFVRALGSEGRVPEDDLAELTDSAVRRAEEGVPMDAVLAAYFRGSRVATEAVVGTAGPADLGSVQRVVVIQLTFLQDVCAAVAAGYARHGRTVQAEQASARHALVDVLLAGGDPRAAAGPADVRLPERYLVCSLLVGPHPDEADPSVNRQVAERRKLRRVREELERHYAEPVLWRPQSDGALALVPSSDVVRLGQVVREVERAAGTSVHVGAVTAPPEEVATAAEVAVGVAEVARLTGRAGGAHTLADVALDYQLRQPGPAGAVLAARLDPLDDRPDLAETLRSYVAAGLSRRRTAVALGVHPNTVDNRLRRVAALTGLDPTAPADVPTLRAALVARSSLGP
ncbi:PucR family transcriptional regulator [Nocardioides stalactiti]|uniref:PucR family transcriptional regulator n=1 Tax=Nocardioides stalactiti TaxID=2755356 RepID=UPI001600DBE8|nr:helix-turn-helix domain-containing protein [Nocardioides stalactiti]